MFANIRGRPQDDRYLVIVPPCLRTRGGRNNRASTPILRTAVAAVDELLHHVKYWQSVRAAISDAANERRHND